MGSINSINESEIQDSATNLAEDLSMTERIEEFINDLIEKIKAWFSGNNSNSNNSGTSVVNDQEATAIAHEIASDLTFEEIPDSVHNLKERQDDMYTSGMFGWEGSGDGDFNLDDSTVNAEFRKLIDEQGVKNIVTLCGGDADTGIAAKLTELGYSGIKTLSFRIRTVESLQAAEEAYTDNLIKNLGECFNLVQSGKTLIHCQNGAHRSVTVSLIMFMLGHPDLTYEQALEANLSTREAANGHFNEYAKLAKVLENNPELRQKIIAV